MSIRVGIAGGWGLTPHAVRVLIPSYCVEIDLGRVKFNPSSFSHCYTSFISVFHSIRVGIAGGRNCYILVEIGKTWRP
jgi:hypothetical protein